MRDTELNKTLDGVPVLFREGKLALDLVNTEVMRRGKRHDLLATPQDVMLWWQKMLQLYPELEEMCGASEDTTVYDQALLDALKTLRASLRAIFDALVAERAPAQADVNILNATLSTGYVALKLTAQGNLLSAYYSTEPQQGLVLLPLALSALSLIQLGERRRLHRCENERCILFFYDTTRSATRRWCSLGCMDRARSAQRYQQARQHAQQSQL